MVDAAAADLVVSFRHEWEPGGAGGGFFAADPRVRTLLRVVLSYPEVRYVVPDRICFDSAVSPTLLETIAHFLDRQSWLVKHVVIGDRP
jgi:hypothetical protein